MKNARNRVSLLQAIGAMVAGTAAWLLLLTVIQQTSFSPSMQTATATSTCGNGRIDGSETCDDRNANSGDGCSSKCKIEKGYVCEGTRCEKSCGNGKLAEGEQCDDRNTNSGDGCSDKCKVEKDYACTGNIGSKSTCKLKCGNGTVDPGETCDDGNRRAGDGCSDKCKAEKGAARSSQSSVRSSSSNRNRACFDLEEFPTSCSDEWCSLGPCDWKGNNPNVDCLSIDEQPIVCSDQMCWVGPCTANPHAASQNTICYGSQCTTCTRFTDGSERCR